MNKKQNKWLWLLVLLGIAAYFHFAEQPKSKPEQGAAPPKTAVVEQARTPHQNAAQAAAKPGATDGAELIAQAFAEQRSDVQVSGSGKVHRTLPDDT